MAYIGNNPKWKTGKFIPQSSTPSNPTEGEVYYDDGTSQTTAGLYLYQGTAWVKLELSIDLIPRGSIHTFAYSPDSSPTGYLLCDGTAVSRTTYSSLFALVGTTWGVGDGSTTFNLPDLRGMFLRGAGAHGTQNMADGNDFNGGTVGSYSADKFQGHVHEYFAGNTGSAGSLNRSPYAGGISMNQSLGGTATGPVGTPLTDGTNGTPRTGAETKPASYSVAYYIKI